MLHKVQFIIKKFYVDKDLLLVGADFIICFFHGSLIEDEKNVETISIVIAK